MAGKMILLALLLICGASAYVLYGAFKNSPNFKSLVTDQMKMEFVSYAHLIKKVDRLPVAELNNVPYFVSLQNNWGFSIHDKTLIIQAPALEPTPPPELKMQIEEQAEKSIGDFALIWLEDKFHTKKDLLVQVQF